MVADSSIGSQIKINSPSSCSIQPYLAWEALARCAQPVTHSKTVATDPESGTECHLLARSHLGQMWPSLLLERALIPENEREHTLCAHEPGI